MIYDAHGRPMVRAIGFNAEMREQREGNAAKVDLIGWKEIPIDDSETLTAEAIDLRTLPTG